MKILHSFIKKQKTTPKKDKNLAIKRMREVKKMTDLSYKSFKEEALQDSETKKEYDRLRPVWDLRRKLIRLRTEKGVTQAEIAKIMGTNKSSISRLECGEKVNFPTLGTIQKYAQALGYNVKVDFEPACI